ncbi:hypothetical protein FPRO05_02429 [Fusarium proliferatum]|uniref:Uncharacterized protein n=1 Tax=Gibberella intermedia TaxID=948311 RepID=A0A365MYP9_GIBIN|nr:hypothetical protein FPRO05_02429 [Fusarium proliferatum]
MDETARLELRSLISSTASRESGKTPVLHSSGVGEPLRRSSSSWSRRVGLAVLLLIIPIAYSVILAMMAHLHWKKQSSFGDTLLEVLSVASTLWPILFAAVLGPLLKSIALFRAERGSKLGSLEFLLTSQTTASALKNILAMGWIGSWAIGVIAIWSLSPLGATYYLGNNRSQVFQYYRAGASVFFGASAAASLISDMRTILSTSFSTQDILVSHANTSSPHYNETITDLGGKWEASRSGRRDLWRNVRIPFLELLPGYDSDDPHAWVSVPLDEIVPYASLIGLPIRGGSFERPGNSSMAVHFSYQTLSCGNAFNGSEWVRNGSTALWYHNTSASVPLRYQYNDEAAPNMGYPNIWFDFPNTSTLAEHFLATFDMEPQSKLQLVMGGGCTDATDKYTEMLRLCDISTSYIDMQIGCIRATVDADLVCQAKQARHTPSYPIKGNLTALSSRRLGPGILRELPFTGASHHPWEPSTLETYLRDPLGVFHRIHGGYMDDPETTNILGCFTSLPPEIISRRLATVLNTITMSTYEVNVLTGGKGLSLDGGPVLWQNTTATWTEFDRDIYKLNTPWFITTVLSTVVLMICAVANIVVRQRIRAPDFLDSVAGLTRDSQFVDVSQEGSGKNGSDRLEMIKDVKVRICDVYPEREIGKIALTTELNGPELRWERRYA